MVVSHHRFESIHTFFDGIGRTGRIINVLFLMKEELLDIPTLYLSRYILSTKDDYYSLLQDVRENDDCKEWVFYILRDVKITARQTIDIISAIKESFQDYKIGIRKTQRFYSQDLINNLFTHPYTKIDFLQKDLKVSRVTAARYLDELCSTGFLKKRKIGRTNYYTNPPLSRLLSHPPHHHDLTRSTTARKDSLKHRRPTSWRDVRR